MDCIKIYEKSRYLAPKDQNVVHIRFKSNQKTQVRFTLKTFIFFAIEDYSNTNRIVINTSCVLQWLIASDLNYAKSARMTASRPVQ